MHHAGQRAVAAIADIGGGAGDGAGGGKPAEQRRQDIGDALPHQLLVGIVPGAGHAVGHHRGQQRFDRAQHGDGEGRPCQLQHACQRDVRQRGHGQPARQAAKGGADGGDAVKAEQRLHRGGNQQRHQRPGDAPQPAHARRAHYQRQAAQRQRGGGRVPLRQRLQQVPEFFVEMLAGDRRQTEEIAPLADKDDHADASREADDHRRGNEPDHAAQPRQPHRQQDQPSHQGGDLQAVDAMARGHGGQHHDKRAGGPRDLQPAAAEQRHRQPGDDGRVQPLLGLGARGDRERHRQRQRHHPDDHARHDVRQPVAASEQSGQPSFAQRDHASIPRVRAG
ncbi:hypothetical protein D3C72_1276040 [compost metagenome]